MDKHIDVVSDGTYSKGKDRLQVIHYHGEEKATFIITEDYHNFSPFEKKVKVKLKHLEKFIDKLVKVTEVVRNQRNDGVYNGNSEEYFVKKKSKTTLSTLASNGEIGVAINPSNDDCAVIFITLSKADELVLELIALAEKLELEGGE
ncbi:hypothetical protein BPS10C_038 [Bacillus phage BPS10C]|uniref:Uncharacterized protein n=1 Tax=Bacillus phage BPS10C TaxID=1277886 RepID=W5QU81_9CAUD|nr:hypothetical protein BPS10C_038 [Bacillus phage BPS10C]AGI12035.1 hypothetical protein BPS10C_038 [Bacillus phage BPS10C]